MSVLDTSKVMSRALNAAIMSMASRLMPNGFDVSDNAPDTFDKLREHYAKTGRISVWNGASDMTIYGDVEVNFAARAWHDYCHLTGGHDFTLAGETAACEMQIAQLIAIYGDSMTTQYWANILRAEVIGQACHFHAFGMFPRDQVKFVREYLESPNYRHLLRALADDAIEEAERVRALENAKVAA